MDIVQVAVFLGLMALLAGLVWRKVAAARASSHASADKEIFLVAQLDPAEDDPARDDLYTLVGPILLSINPYKPVPQLYATERMDE